MNRVPALFMSSVALRAWNGVFVCVVILVFANISSAQEVDLAERYEKVDVMIPVRDGVKLYTEIYSPKKLDKKLLYELKDHY